MDALDLIRLRPLMEISKGSSDISIGIIDGPVDLDHPSYSNSKIRTTKESEYAKCTRADSISCLHGTFVTGMLVSERGSSALAICPDCEIILRPIFNDNHSGLGINQYPSSTPQGLADAIVEIVDAGAAIINLSLGLSSSSMTKFSELHEAYDYAFRKHVIIVAAAGNQGNIGFFPVIDHPWVIPVVSCDMQGRFNPMSNIGPSIAKRGVMAPGVDITSTSPRGGYEQLSGTSFAAPFVTGTIALLLSIIRKATPAQLVRSIRQQLVRRRTIFPPLCDAKKSMELLHSDMNSHFWKPFQKDEATGLNQYMYNYSHG
jgi:subtilisin family serine protease